MNGGYFAIQKELHARLREPAPGRIQLLSGPRQVGKTTLLLEIARDRGDDALYLAADSPEASLPDWWLTRWQRAVRMARRGPSVLLVDEIHGLPDWSRWLKVAYDEIQRERLPLHIIVSGSSSLQLAGGARESMAGRFERLNLRHWTARDLIDGFAFTPEAAVMTFVRYGTFPGGVGLLANPLRWKAYLRDAIIDPAIGSDIVMLRQVRKPALLRQIFAVCIGHPGEVISLQKIAGSLTDAGNMATVADYLMLLGDAYLAAALPKYAMTEVRRRATPPKLVTLSNAFLAAATDDDPPTPASDPRRWGHWLENACIARAINDGHTVTYWREAQQEVDMIIDGAAGKWAVEIKSGDYTIRDLVALLEFCRRNPGYRPMVIGSEQYQDAAVRADIEYLSWQEYLLDGLTQ
ncbi:MAG: ATP-binding protein [Armatimonadota bacterium]